MRTIEASPTVFRALRSWRSPTTPSRFVDPPTVVGYERMLSVRRHACLTYAEQPTEQDQTAD